MSLSPAQPKVGDTVNVTVGLLDSNDQNEFKSMGADIKIWVVNDSFLGSNDIRLNKSYSGNSFQGSFIAGGSLITKAGNYKLHTEVSYQITGAMTQMYSFAQDNPITVLAADTTGGPKLNVNNSESFANGPEITKGVSWTYLDGGSGKQAASYKVDCGDGKGLQAVSSGQTSFRCIYDKTAKDYSAKVVAYDTSGAQIVASAFTNSVTGNESTQGAGNNPSADNDGGYLAGFINKIVGFVLGIVQELIFAIFYYLVVPIVQAMLSIRVYKDEFVSVIYPGWLVLRNLCNIIFIVAIMAIAMGTLLRVDAYKSRSVLVQLILAALLVNFSLVIGQVVLGIADTVQSQFLPNNKEVIRALGKDLMVAYRSDVFDTPLKGYWSDIVKQFIFLTLAAGSFMVFLAIAAFLFIRMIMIWILLMLSPLAYAAGALPSTAHYRKEWWTTFLKYAFFTPIMAFFLNMTAIISNTYKTNPIFSSMGLKDTDFGAAGNSVSAFVFKVGSTLLLVVFLIVALKVAESFSIFGASEVSKFAKKGMFAPVGIAGKLAKAGAERGFEAVQNKTGVTMDPRIWKHEFEEYFEKQKKNRMLAREAKKFKGVPFGAPRDMLENYWNGKGVKRVWQSRFGLDGYGKRFALANAEHDKATKVLTQDEQTAASDSRVKLQRASANLSSEKIDKDDIANFGLQIDEVIQKLNKQIAAAQAEEDKLRKGGDASGAAKKNAEVLTLQTKLGDLAAKKSAVEAAGAAGTDFDASAYNAASPEFKAAFEKHRTDTIAALEDVDQKLKNDAEARAKYKISDWKEDNRKDALAKYAILKERAEQVERPEAYYARAARLEREQDESKKISHIHDEGELNKLLRNAIRQKDSPKAVAILKKLTRDRNLNEVLEDFGYATSFEDHTDASGKVTKGVKSFFVDKIEGELGMEKEEMLEVATEVGYEAEESKQYNASRLTWIDPNTGHLDFNGYTEHGHKEHPMHKNNHTGHVLTEARKSEPRKRYGELPRWCYVVEGPDAAGNRKRLGFTDIGKDLLLDACGNDEVIRNIKSQGNTFSMKAITSVEGWQKELMDRGKERGCTTEEVNKLTDAIQTAAGRGK